WRALFAAAGLAAGAHRHGERVVRRARARGRPRRGHRRVRHPAGAVAALRGGRRGRPGHRPGARARCVGPARAARGPGGPAQRRRHTGGRGDRVLAAEAAMTERGLLAAARAGDEDAFARLVAAHRAGLHAHCYRMLGSVQDGEDALQETLLRAWRGLARFEGRSSLRSWLYAIATNACLKAIERRPRRVLPVDFGPAADPHDGPAEPLVESVWIEPYPDAVLGAELGAAAPVARYEQRESVELAFIAALQHLPPRQR